MAPTAAVLCCAVLALQVVSRRFSKKGPDQAMVGSVTAQQLCLYAARQLHVELPRELLMMDDHAPITQFGSYTVPLNLRDEQGQQVELLVQVNKTYR
jgi:ribosomal protein L9